MPPADDVPLPTGGSVRTWIQLAAYIVAIVLAYSALSERIARVEERQEVARDELRDIKQDLKTLLRRP